MWLHCALVVVHLGYCYFDNMPGKLLFCWPNLLALYSFPVISRILMYASWAVERKMHAATIARSIHLSYIKGADGAMRPHAPNNTSCQLLRLLLKSPGTASDFPVLFLFFALCHFNLSLFLHVYIVGIIVSCGSTRLLFDTVFLPYYSHFLYIFCLIWK